MSTQVTRPLPILFLTTPRYFGRKIADNIKPISKPNCHRRRRCNCLSSCKQLSLDNIHQQLTKAKALPTRIAILVVAGAAQHARLVYLAISVG